MIAFPWVHHILVSPVQVCIVKEVASLLGACRLMGMEHTRTHHQATCRQVGVCSDFKTIVDCTNPRGIIKVPCVLPLN